MASNERHLGQFLHFSGCGPHHCHINWVHTHVQFPKPYKLNSVREKFRIRVRKIFRRAKVKMATEKEPSEFVELVSKDGFAFEVRREVATLAGTIRRMLDPKSEVSCIP
jgi:hypothetical protein